MAKTVKVQNKRSNELNNQNKVKSPQPSDLVYGELAINYKKNYETLFIKNDNDEIVPLSFHSNIGNIEDYWKNIEDSAVTISDVISMLNYNMATLKTYVDANFARKPVTIWETDGTTGLLGVNDNTMNLTTWQLENLDFSPYKFVLAYFKQADRDFSSLQTNYVTPSVAVCIPLDEASVSTGYTAYIGGTNTTNPNDRNVQFCVIAAIDETKTKFKVVSEHSIYGTALGGRNDNGRFCYKIVGYYE